MWQKLRVKRTILHRLSLKNSTQNNEDNLNSVALLVKQGDWAILEKKGCELLLQNPPQYEAIAYVAYNLQQAGCFEAVSVIAVQTAPFFSEYWIFPFLAGVALKERKKLKEACQYLRQALVLRPDDQQTLGHWIDAIAKTDGIELAASFYISHCQQMGNTVDILVAPISTVHDWAQKKELFLLETGEVEKIPFKHPHIWGERVASETIFALSNKPYVVDIKDARIFSNSSIILTAEGTALSDMGAHPDFGPYISFAYEKIVLTQEADKVLLNFGEFQTREIEAGILLSGLASSFFGHWFPDFLPKLKFLQQHPDFINLPIIVDVGMPQSHFEHLRRFANNPLILLQANESLLCKRLLVASSPTFFPVEMLPNSIPVQELPGLSPRAMCFLRGNEFDNTMNPGNRRIFLARKNMKWRRVLNEEEIAIDLLKIGFETVYIEEMTMREQIKLFQSAQCIVAPNGSALLNLIFAAKETKLVVLLQPNVFNWGTFQGPMDALGYQSICVSGEYAKVENQKHSDYYVSIQKIYEALSYLGIDEQNLNKNCASGI